MKKAGNWMLLLICIVVCIIILAYEKRIPQIKGEKKISILNDTVDVFFDEYGIPHIDAKNSDDAYMALGYITASERLFQMDLMRRVVSGRLSEVFGETTLDLDKLVRKLKIKKSANLYLQNKLQQLEPQMLTQMRAYLEGVHFFMKTQSLPLEFLILGYTPDEFELSDIFALPGYMAMTFAEGLTTDILFSELMETLPQEKMEVLRIGDNTDRNYFSDQKIVRAKILDDIHNKLDQLTNYIPMFHGSNSWVLAGKRTISGKPILANDPHIALSNPHIFYEAHLKFPGFEVYGNFIPLSPFPVLGHTPHSAWGVTMAELDDVSIYLEKINPENKNQIMFKNEWIDMTKSVESIKVKGGANVEIELFETPHGPVLAETKYSVPGKIFSLSWSVYHPDNDVIQSFYELPMARNIESFKTAVSHAAAPGLNISWVNTEGDIAWWVMGKFPKLPIGVPYDVVLNGWDGKHEFERFYAIEENPHQINPESGVIITANYKPQLSEFSHFDGYWQPGGRYFRIEKLLNQQERWDVAGLMSIQLDGIIPIYTSIIKQIDLGINESHLNKFEKKAMDRFMHWNGDTGTTSIGSSIYFMLMATLTQNIFKDELGEDNYNRFIRSADYWHAQKELLFNQEHSFWDDVKTNRVESGSEIITKSFKATVQKLSERLGEKIDQWQWGKLHSVTYKHPLGKQWPLNLIYNIGPLPAAGGRYAINNLGHKKGSDQFQVVHAPATRRIIDMVNPQDSFGIFPTGNSANPFSDFFNDQLELYHAGKYRAQTMDWVELRKLPKLKLIK